MKLFASFALASAMAVTSSAAAPWNPPSDARPALPSNVDVEYAVAVGGFSIGTINLSARFEDDAYELDGLLVTDGIVATFFPAVFKLESDGKFDDTRVRPTRFLSDFASEDKKRRIELAYTPAGDPVMSALPAYSDGYGPEITRAIRLDTQDPVSVLLQPVPAGAKGPCDRSMPVFDGRRRYDLMLAYDSHTMIDGGPDGYSGQAVKCRVRLEPVAGYKKRRMYEMLRDGNNARIWLVPVHEGEVYMPVKLVLRTPLGGAVARAVRFAAGPLTRTAGN